MFVQVVYGIALKFERLPHVVTGLTILSCKIVFKTRWDYNSHARKYSTTRKTIRFSAHLLTMNLARAFYRTLSTTKASLCAVTDGINQAERTTTFGFESVSEEEKTRRGVA